MRKNHIELVLNKALKEHKDLLFGENSTIVVERVDWVLSKKSHIVSVKILTDEVEKSFESHPDGINFLMRECWTALGRVTDVIVVSSIDIND